MLCSSFSVLYLPDYKFIFLFKHICLHPFTLFQESLASLGIVHGDLACRNVYLDGQGVVKITDFGIRGKEKTYSNSRIYPSTEFGRRPLKWLSPEAIVEGTTTVASDVWAFGITLWEIVTLGKGWQELNC